MTQYIDKSIIVTEIKDRIKEIESMQPKFDQFWVGLISALKGIIKILDTLEVKDIDLEKEIQSWIEDNSVNGYYREDVYETARYFFELGLKAAQKGK